LLRPDGAGGPRRAQRPRAAPRGAAGRPHRPRAPRAAGPAGLRRQEPAYLQAGGGARAADRGGQPGRGDHRAHWEQHVNRHLISAADLSRDDALLILDTADELARMADRPIKKLPTPRGRTVVNLFFEDSTRTRISFEAAAKRLSADVINFSAKGSSVAKGESLKDTAMTLEAMGADAVVIRHSASGAPHRL